MSAKTLTMPQAGLLATCTELLGATALGSRVTGTIKSGILQVDEFVDHPGVLMMTMVVAEFGSATWLMIATRFQMPVSTTQSLVGALVGCGIAARRSVTWRWTGGSVSQIAASWGIAPAVSAGFGFVIFGIVKYSVLERADPVKWALRMIPLFFALTAAILALFIVVEASYGIPSLEELGANAAGIVLGVFGVALLIAYVFFQPYFYRKLVRGDARIRYWHIPLGPLLWRDDPWLYWPSDSELLIEDYYDKTTMNGRRIVSDDVKDYEAKGEGEHDAAAKGKRDHETTVKGEGEPDNKAGSPTRNAPEAGHKTSQLAEVDELPWSHPRRLYATARHVITYGMTRDIIGHQSRTMAEKHKHAPVYDNRVEHMFTFGQVASAMLMSIAHGSNDVANAAGPFSAVYQIWRTSTVEEESETPPWILAVGGVMLGVGFLTYGYHMMRALGNKITIMTPSRGFAMEMGAAITVLMASRLALPVSTTQCITGSIIGVAALNFDLRSLNWRQIGWIVFGWILTLPCAGLISGLVMAIFLNTPHF